VVQVGFDLSWCGDAQDMQEEMPSVRDVATCPDLAAAYEAALLKSRSSLDTEAKATCGSASKPDPPPSKKNVTGSTAAVTAVNEKAAASVSAPVNKNPPTSVTGQKPLASNTVDAVEHASSVSQVTDSAAAMRRDNEGSVGNKRHAPSCVSFVKESTDDQKTAVTSSIDAETQPETVADIAVTTLQSAVISVTSDTVLKTAYLPGVSTATVALTKTVGYKSIVTETVVSSVAAEAGVESTANDELAKSASMQTLTADDASNDESRSTLEDVRVVSWLFQSIKIVDNFFYFQLLK
jgi:hypothetical protein